MTGAAPFSWDGRLLEQLSTPVLVTDSSRQIVFANAAFCEMSGYYQHSLLGSTPKIFQSGYTSRETYESLHRTIGMGLPWRGQLINRHSGGRFYRQDLSISPVWAGTNGERAAYYIGIAREVPESRHFVRHDPTNAALLGQIGAGLSHSCGNLLTTIIDEAAATAGELPEDDVRRPRLAALAARCEELSAVTKRFLLAAGRLEVVPEVVPLGDLFQDLLYWFEGQKYPGIQIEVRPPSPEAAISGDRVLLVQMLRELLGNAAEACGKSGRVVLTARSPAGGRSRPIRYGQDCLRIVVKDEGPGIPSELRSRVFEPFFSTKSVGRGLGLPVAVNIATAHRASLRLHSPPEGGLAAHIGFPPA